MNENFGEKSEAIARVNLKSKSALHRRPRKSVAIREQLLPSREKLTGCNVLILNEVRPLSYFPN